MSYTPTFCCEKCLLLVRTVLEAAQYKTEHELKAAGSLQYPRRITNEEELQMTLSSIWCFHVGRICSSELGHILRDEVF